MMHQSFLRWQRGWKMIISFSGWLLSELSYCISLRMPPSNKQKKSQQKRTWWVLLKKKTGARNGNPAQKMRNNPLISPFLREKSNEYPKVSGSTSNSYSLKMPIGKHLPFVLDQMHPKPKWKNNRYIWKVHIQKSQQKISTGLFSYGFKAFIDAFMIYFLQCVPTHSYISFFSSPPFDSDSDTLTNFGYRTLTGKMKMVRP